MIQRFKLPLSQAIVLVFTKLPQLFKDTPTLKAFNSRIKGYLACREFDNVDECIALDR